MTTVRFHQTLFYYDGPQVFEARDPIGGHYVGVMSPEPPDAVEGECLVVGVAPAALARFRAGNLDLRALLVESDRGLRYHGVMPNDLGDDIVLHSLTPASIEERLLPSVGFLLEPPAEDAVVREARVRNNLVVKVAVESPEAAGRPRIQAAALAELLHRIQMLVRRAHVAVTRGSSEIRLPDEDKLDVVVPAAAGSFEVTLEAHATNLFGSKLGPAMRLLDQLFSDVEDPDLACEAALQFRGHVAGAYLRLLRFLNEQKTGLRYAWAEPSADRASRRSISRSEANVLVDFLSQVEDLGTESVDLEGTFERFDRGNGQWGLNTESGLRRGEVRESSVSLDGLQVGARYRFHCDEEIQQNYVSGREHRVLFLRDHQPAPKPSLPGIDK